MGLGRGLGLGLGLGLRLGLGFGLGLGLEGELYIDGELGAEDDGARDGVVLLHHLEDGRRHLVRVRVRGLEG